MSRLRLPRLNAFLVGLLLLNLVLLLASCWGRAGQTIDIRMDARGDEFTAYVDGVRALDGTFSGVPEGGGVILTLENTNNIPSLPSPRGIDSVRVTNANGQVLFQDDFSSGPMPRWQVLDGHFEEHDGVLGGAGVLAVIDPSWSDYTLEVRFRNIVGAIVTMRADRRGDGVAYHFRPPSQSLVTRDETVEGGKVELSKRESFRALVGMALGTYPRLLALLGLGSVVVAGLAFARPPHIRALERVPARARPWLPWAAAATIAFAAFGIAMFIMYSYVTRIPHVPDADAYLFQAKLLASGHFSASPPPVPEAFQFFVQNFIRVEDGKWAAIYPFGHPLLLAIGTKVGAVWLVPPLVGAASVALLFAVGRRLYNTRVALLGALLLATSPFFLMTATNFMAHNTAVFYLLASLLCLIYIDKRPVLLGVLAGLCFGLLFNTRPLTAMALAVPFGAYLASGLIDRERRVEGAKAIGSFVTGGLLMLLAYWAYNYGTTGSAFSSGYSGTMADESLGFGGRHSVANGLQNEETQLKLLLLVLNGWPQYVGLMFVAVPFVSLSRNRYDWFLGACALFVMAAPAFWWGEGVMHGPRYWYEATPFLILLTARGADRAAELIAGGAAWLRRVALRDGRAPPVWAGLAVSYAFVLALTGSSLYGWLLGHQTSWAVPFTPARAQELEGLFGVDNRLVAAINDADLDNALVLVEDCGLGDKWGCYGSVFWMNSPELDGDVVLARDVPELRDEIITAFAGRDVYRATYRITWIEPYVPEDEPPGADGAIQ